MKGGYTCVVVGHWKGAPQIKVQQVYGPFSSFKAARAWVHQRRDPSWRWTVFACLNPEENR